MRQKAFSSAGTPHSRSKTRPALGCAGTRRWVIFGEQTWVICPECRRSPKELQFHDMGGSRIEFLQRRESLVDGLNILI